MKAKIHPQYYPTATVHCSGCDTTYSVGSTTEKIAVELCSNCHPFYTGKQKLVDTAGRVDRFRARLAKAKSSPLADSTKTTEPAVAETVPAEPTTEDRLSQMKQDLERGGAPKSSSDTSSDPDAKDK